MAVIPGARGSLRFSRPLQTLLCLSHSAQIQESEQSLIEVEQVQSQVWSTHARGPRQQIRRSRLETFPPF